MTAEAKQTVQAKTMSNTPQSSTADVCVMGLGYIGLPTAAVIARSGLRVHGVDLQRRVVDTINRGAIHIEENDLEALVHACVQDGTLRAATEPVPAAVFLIAVPTPFKGDHEPDISYVLQAVEAIAPHLKPRDLVIVESTCPIGTTDAVRDRIAELRPDLEMPTADAGQNALALSYCPERVLPGKIIAELVSNDRSIGGLTPRCAERARAFYQRFVEGECIVTAARTAEMVKLVENASRDVGIAFANELSMVADKLDIDVWEVIALANRHPRVNILSPGPGVGGHCIAVDPWFLVDSARELTPLIRTAREVNDSKPDYVVARVAALMRGRPEARLACLGLTFKPDVDDLRESPSVAIAAKLADLFPGRVLAVDPHVESLPGALADKLQLYTLGEAQQQCDLGLLLVDHKEFRALAEPPFSYCYDTRGLWH